MYGFIPENFCSENVQFYMENFLFQEHTALSHNLQNILGHIHLL
ncbi:2720_t:CDS:2 [Entrophospora sp. SA101]|nr:2720_t:CDS:2 [Entrophospora sp. SA101]